MRNNKIKLLYMLIIGSLLISCVPLFTADPFYGHDIGFHLSRIQSIADCLKNGSFPAMIYPNYFNGYGYANGVFYPDLFLYIPGTMVFFGLECKFAYSIFISIVNLATFYSMYYCIKKINNDGYSSAIISCIYLLSSYRITDLYVRSALGETLSFIFIPFVILGVYELLYEDYDKGYYLIIGLFGVLSSHILSLLFCVLFIFLVYLMFFFRSIKNKQNLITRTLAMSSCCLLSVGICSYFLFPFAEMLMSDKFLFQTSPAIGGWDRTIPLLLSLIEVPTWRDTFFPLGIGLSFVFISFLLIKNYKNISRFSKDMLIIGVFFWLMTTNLFPWKLFHKVAIIIQFPWRFMILAAACLLFGSAERLLTFIKNCNPFHIAILFSVLIMYSVLTSAYDMYVIQGFKLYTDDVHYSVGGAEYVPDKVTIGDLYARGNIVSSNRKIHINYAREKGKSVIDYSGNSYDDSYLELPLIYYKGYKAYENGTQLEVIKGDNGLLKIPLQNTQGSIIVYYGLTSLRITGALVSILSLIGTIILSRKS